jgi:hypothetical protein
MTTIERLQQIVDNLPANFYGSVTIGFQNSIPGTVEVKQSYRLETPKPQTSRPTSRGASNDPSNSRNK